MIIRHVSYGLRLNLALAALLAAPMAAAVTTTCSTASGTNCSIRIPDAQGATPGVITSTVTAGSCASGNTHGAVSARVKITHNWIGDLQITLTNPSLTVVPLLLNLPDPTGSVGGCQADDIDATFADSGAAAICGSTIPALSGTVLPAAPLAPLSAQSTTGTWTLTVKDTQNSGDGKLNDWSISVSCMVADIDGDGSVTALTDGLLVLRYLFGLTGPELTSGAIGGSASRTTPAQIKAYLDSVRAQFDIDGNGNVDPLTDGLLFIRYVFGVRGTSLTDNSVGPGATRTTSTQIEAYIQSLIQ